MSRGENVSSEVSSELPVDVPASVPVQVPVQAEAPPVPAERPAALKRIESKFPRGLIIRLTMYLFVGHLFAFFVYLLFVLGAKNQ
ncbi:DUF6126 family protein [Streptomyces sp. NPDC002138]|uniref:DUF6126 family protein n=1 Tax=Streptomyces sp. NPDC002138 TaxID=3154410 RepID=UPI00331E6D05